jgi:hypothetical protein
MKCWIYCGAIVLATAGAAVGLAQGDKQGKPQDASAIMEKMKAFATPGEGHKVLESRVGNWTIEVKVFEPGETEPTVSTGTSSVKWIFDGRYLHEEVSGSFMEMPFQGVGTTGYDNLKKKYVGSWIDNMGTGIGRSEGTYDAATKTFTFSFEAPDVMAGKYVKGRSIEKMVDADHYSAEMYQPGPDGKEYKSMELHYMRKK